MGKLLKYEMRKTMALKLILLGITAVAEVAFLITLYLNEKAADTLALTSVLLFFIALAGTVLIGVQSVLTLHRDMNTKQGYMLYMTPRNSFQILGAKMLENGLSLLLAGGFFFLLGLLDVTLLFSKLGSLEDLWKMFQDFMRMINTEIQLNSWSVLCLVTEMLASWLATVSIAYLADIVASALLNGKKFNGLVAFLFFILLTMALNWLQHLFVPGGMPVISMLLVQAVVALIYSAVMYVISALVMDRYLSV
jgi:hypothetical protein